MSEIVQKTQRRSLDFMDVSCTSLVRRSVSHRIEHARFMDSLSKSRQMEFSSELFETCR